LLIEILEKENSLIDEISKNHESGQLSSKSEQSEESKLDGSLKDSDGLESEESSFFTENRQSRGTMMGDLLRSSIQTGMDKYVNNTLLKMTESI
jgi:hypothetical protein